MQDSLVKRFWETRAQDQSLTDVEATHSDVWQRWLEIETIKPYLRSDDRLVDVGCGSGYATRLLSPLVREAVGFDYAESMIARARAATAGRAGLRFEVADVLSLDPKALGTFDVALSVRCLINLESWELQQRAIESIARLVRPGGRYIMVEGSADGRQALNDLRKSVGLSEMPTVWHNIDFEEATLLPCLDRFFTVAERRHFGVYDFVARVVHPMAVAPEQPVYDSAINRTGAQLAVKLQEFGHLSRVVFLVLVRRA
ncbi:MAG TPA: class I SAM-dependent methyltransferase [Vicinamibacterales bacterium]|nr:class I SAM-dependent methyltransferase [Vicinamibacterales bacterium]